ncbi:adenylate/guanylate cyclase domain-containing protein [Candidatus Uhrbacteria bacterium]|nr:adenylate/guanylate cyclase domain-containing protein [Candidatus Uhrbacteria bacterium]
MKKFLRTYRSTLLGGVIGLLGAIGFLSGAFSSWSAQATDRFFLERKADARIVIVGIDDASLARIGRWPWPRDVHAKLIDTLAQAGVKVIGYDVNFPEATEAARDQALADAIKKAGNVILPIELSLKSSSNFFMYDPKSIVQPITLIQSAARGVGHTNTPLDSDGVVRFVPLTVQAPRSTVPAFAYEIASLAGAVQELPQSSDIPFDKRGRLIINYPDAPRQAFRIISAGDLLQGKISVASLKDAIVLVGATASDLHDQQEVPTSSGTPMSGVEIHASILDTLLSRHWLVFAPRWIEALFLIILALFLGWWIAYGLARKRVVWVGIGLWLAWLIFAFVAFDYGLVFDVVWPTITIFILYAALLLERWLATEQARSELRTTFSRYVSPTVVESVLRDPSKLKQGGERRHMTVLFSDLRGFTTLSEGLSPEKLVTVLNTYLDAMTRLVFEQEGVLDKYIGDAVMAFWNAPFEQLDHAVRAVRTAVKMRARLRELNKTGAFPSGIELKVGIGMNTGDMVVGNIGAEMRYDYTVIGDTVNLGSRVESLCKEYGVEIIITDAVKRELDDQFVLRILDQVAVKGKKEPIRIFEVLGERSQATEEELALATKSEQLFESYLTARFEDVLKEGSIILQIMPQDAPTKLLMERAKFFIDNPPPAPWTGVWVMTKK